jgi:hypothetical protein
LKAKNFNQHSTRIVENETEFKTEENKEPFTLRHKEEVKEAEPISHVEPIVIVEEEQHTDRGENLVHETQNGNENEEERKRVNAANLFRRNIFNSLLKEKVDFVNSKNSDIISLNNGHQMKFHPRVIEVDSTLQSMPTYIPSITQRFIKCRHRVNLPPVYTNRDREESYQGSWNVLTGKFNGYGIFQDKDGAKYEGIWIEGILHNYGRVIHITGDCYEGQVVFGEFSGQGTFKHYQGAIYRGDFKKNQMEGNGEETFADGSHFKGQFKNGKKNGNGTFRWNDGSQYTGNFVDNLFEGFGVYTWADGRSYTGEFKNNLFNGQGLHRFPDGKYFKGTFVDNKRNGEGFYAWSEIKYYEGSWKDGFQHGKGTYFNDGKSVVGVWENGKIVTTTSKN